MTFLDYTPYLTDEYGVCSTDCLNFLIDPGVARAMGHLLNVPPQPGTSYFGDLFEHLVVAELYARSAYEQLDWQFSYLLTKDDVEIDLVIARPGRPPALVEIKSTGQVREEHARSLQAFQRDFPDADLCLLSRDPRPQRLGRVRCLPWAEGILEL